MIVGLILRCESFLWQAKAKLQKERANTQENLNLAYLPFLLLMHFFCKNYAIRYLYSYAAYKGKLHLA